MNTSIRINKRKPHSRASTTEQPQPDDSTSISIERQRLHTENKIPTTPHHSDSHLPHKARISKTKDAKSNQVEIERQRTSLCNTLSEKKTVATSKNAISLHSNAKTRRSPKGSAAGSNKPVHINDDDTYEITYTDYDNVDVVIDRIENDNLNHTGNKHEDPDMWMQSLETSDNPKVGSAFFDRLTITFDTPCVNARQILKRVDDLKERIPGHYFLYRLSATNSSYQYRFSFRREDQQQAALIEFGSSNANAKAARIDFNPKELGRKGLREIRRLLQYILGDDYERYVLDSNFTRLDATVDIHNASPDDLLMFSNRHCSSSLWIRQYDRDGRETWKTETQCLGSEASDYYVQKYNKTLQMWQVKNQKLADLVTRIEARLSPRDKSGQAINVSDIWAIKNPFSKIRIAHYSSLGIDSGEFGLFVIASRQIGAEAALGMIKHRSKRAQYHAKLVDQEPGWWNPEILWDQALAALRATRLFPDQAFEGPKKGRMKRL
jgi:hypothetical protein